VCTLVYRSFLAFSFHVFFDFFLMLRRNSNVCILLRFRTQTVFFSHFKSTSWSATLPSRTSWAVENNTNCLINYHYYYTFNTDRYVHIYRQSFSGDPCLCNEKKVILYIELFSYQLIVMIYVILARKKLE